MASYRYERNIKEEDLRPLKERHYTRKERWNNWWDYNLKWVVLAVIVVGFVGYCFIGQYFFTVHPDYNIGVVAPYYLPEDTVAAPQATEEQLWQVLEQVKLAGFLRQEQGLRTPLLERASNLSGGQCQRLALARGLLHNSPVYIFDEATSNIDVESENDIMEEIRALAKTKTVLLISHRLANVVDADCIYVLDKGQVAESGTHQELLGKNGAYRRLWDAQAALEHYGEEVNP